MFGEGGVGEGWKCKETGELASQKVIIINYCLLNTSSRNGPGRANRKGCSVLAGKGPGGRHRQEALLGLKKIISCFCKADCLRQNFLGRGRRV